jgi:SsrA-binding protein
MASKKAPKAADGARRVIASNRKARHDYEILERLEAGIQLVGSEVKSLRGGKVTFADAHVAFEGGEAFLYQLHIPEYVHANQFNHDPTRKRRLLMKQEEIARLEGKVREAGLALIPLELYFKGSWVKVEIALARGRKLHDKREALKEKDSKREIRQARD